MASYKNLDGTVPDKGIGALLKWQVTDRIAGKWRRDRTPFVTPRRENDGTALKSTEPHLTWVGHATFVQRLGGQLLATDPIWSTRIHTIMREAAPGIALDVTPKLDVVTADQDVSAPVGRRGRRAVASASLPAVRGAPTGMRARACGLRRGRRCRG